MEEDINSGRLWRRGAFSFDDVPDDLGLEWEEEQVLEERDWDDLLLALDIGEAEDLGILTGVDILFGVVKRWLFRVVDRECVRKLVMGILRGPGFVPYQGEEGMLRRRWLCGPFCWGQNSVSRFLLRHVTW